MNIAKYAHQYLFIVWGHSPFIIHGRGTTVATLPVADDGTDGQRRRMRRRTTTGHDEKIPVYIHFLKIYFVTLLGHFVEQKRVENIFKLCSHIQQKTTNPNPIFKILIYCTKDSNNIKIHSKFGIWGRRNKHFQFFQIYILLYL